MANQFLRALRTRSVGIVASFATALTLVVLALVGAPSASAAVADDPATALRITAMRQQGTEIVLSVQNAGPSPCTVLSGSEATVSVASVRSGGAPVTPRLVTPHYNEPL